MTVNGCIPCKVQRELFGRASCREHRELSPAELERAELRELKHGAAAIVRMARYGAANLRELSAGERRAMRYPETGELTFDPAGRVVAR